MVKKIRKTMDAQGPSSDAEENILWFLRDKAAEVVTNLQVKIKNGNF